MRIAPNIISFLLAILFSVSSCKKNTEEVTSPDNSTLAGIFENFWNNMNRNYVYWSADATDWDIVYKIYKDKFSTLSLQDPEDQKKAFAYFKEITANLIDCHYYIKFNTAALRDSVIYPAYERKKNRPGFRNPFSYFTLASGYLDPGYAFGYDNSTNPQLPFFCLSGTVNSNILYFSCSSFSLFRSFHSAADNAVKPVISYFLDQLENSSSLQGVIIDLRNNSGGDLSDLNFLAGRFISEPLHFGYTRYKRAAGRLDYTPWINSYLSPQTPGKNVAARLVILTDNYTGSLAEAITMALRARPGCQVVGEKTFGATGPITLNEIYNSGSFELGNFLTVQTSSAQFRYIDGEGYENTGFTPDVLIPYNPATINSGVDQQLEKAIALLQ